MTIVRNPIQSLSDQKRAVPAMGFGAGTLSKTPSKSQENK
jgi:hypothetical protein